MQRDLLGPVPQPEITDFEKLEIRHYEIVKPFYSAFKLNLSVFDSLIALLTMH